MFDIVHIRKNVAETLWKILDRRNEKEIFFKICNDIEEANHAMRYVIQFHRNKDQININSLPWILIEKQNNVIK